MDEWISLRFLADVVLKNFYLPTLPPQALLLGIHLYIYILKMYNWNLYSFVKFLCDNAH